MGSYRLIEKPATRRRVMNELEHLRAELRAQDEALATATEQLAEMGEVQFHIPRELLEQLDDACTVRASGTIQLGAVKA